MPKRWDAATTLDGLTEARRVIGTLGEVSFEADEMEAALRALCEARGWKAGDLFMAIRVAVTGRTATPPLFDTIVALGTGADAGAPGPGPRRRSSPAETLTGDVRCDGQPIGTHRRRSR